MAAPTRQAGSIVFSKVSATTLTAAWTRGDGDFIVVFATAAPSGDLSDGILDGNTYTAEASFGRGSQPGAYPDWYCVYNGIEFNVAITDLIIGTTYTFQAFEYKGTGGAEEYLVGAVEGNPATITTARPYLLGAFDDDDE